LFRSTSMPYTRSMIAALGAPDDTPGNRIESPKVLYSGCGSEDPTLLEVSRYRRPFR